MHTPIKVRPVIYAICTANTHEHASSGCLVNSTDIIGVEGAPRNAVKASIGTPFGHLLVLVWWG
jgi:hypothetical protein